MKYCPKCNCVMCGQQKCSNCAWNEKESTLRKGPMAPKVEKQAVLTPPRIGLSHVREARYLTHCVSIGQIIAHSSLPYHQKIEEYLEITKEEEVA